MFFIFVRIKYSWIRFAEFRATSFGGPWMKKVHQLTPSAVHFVGRVALNDSVNVTKGSFNKIVPFLWVFLLCTCFLWRRLESCRKIALLPILHPSFALSLYSAAYIEGKSSTSVLNCLFFFFFLVGLASSSARCTLCVHIYVLYRREREREREWVAKVSTFFFFNAIHASRSFWWGGGGAVGERQTV